MILNNIFANWNKGIYIAKTKEIDIDPYGNEIRTFYQPQWYSFNIRPLINQTTGSVDVYGYGDRVTKMQQAVIPEWKYRGEFQEGDVAYLEGLQPSEEETEDTYGISANYKIVSVRPVNTTILIYFERLN